MDYLIILLLFVKLSKHLLNKLVKINFLIFYI